ncbi:MULTISPECIES: hypothetical protein [unclassified Rhizobium]|uniref:hypothetical protein n=1 Tax=unclassified Rhizobium TaxID=2613769 RepID=UPI001A992D71|nr:MULTISPECIES: hypothetical protein [unclassified Rhizobium]MBX5159893.1 hypothetical protein [Rhizobium sp. NZLR8]MBX5166063.1 hypothetical protein [Rhizobium sp. NZLR4b]MBX5174004.1 hypothetical protein [Rhizobium sp. NZLR1b]MBX5185790.1 hypothetical protein [Rhizobium sp. NZLR5]MBX5190029.1 hypothetical protein [Rhizobium sp. NZLR3b]
MDCHAIEERRPQQRIQIFRRLADWLAGGADRFRRLPRLDLSATPDRVKRDLGFLDGRDPYYEDERMR